MLVLSIDPGVATGFALGHYDDSSAYQLQWVTTLHDGLDGFLEWWQEHTDYYEGWGNVFDHFGVYPSKMSVVIEGFRPRGGNNFTADLSGVEIIGYLKGVMGSYLTIQMPTDKALVPDAVLKEHGLWQTGKMVNHKDGRDANDAIIHGLAYLHKRDHDPTLRRYFSVES